ncbi:MAG TPA: tRNA guanosine(34) transglycosylase Tgt [Bacteroidetes bacterium]|nr:tRNA guanosine(34) transglycosylase Tgt [Bacteroidota bacterium]
MGSVKAVEQRELKNDVKAQIILGNTYHLYLRPGMEIMQKAGGLHKFINWDKPILTDSGGYQVYSLSKRRKITEEGVMFYSHIDGSKHHFTPESIMDIERKIGADIMMAFDECPPYPSDYNYAKNSMELTHRWLKRCITRFDSSEDLYGHKQILAPIVQGSTYKDLRQASAEFVAEQERDLNAIGGLSVGEPHEMMYEMTDLVCNILPHDKPRYLMGVGTPINILESIALGVDMFDCVMPTRNARHGLLYTWNGIINIKNAKWKEDFDMIDENLDCYTSNVHSKAYLHHLFRTKELLGLQIASIHNLTFYLDLVKNARIHIIKGDFNVWKEKMVKVLGERR